MKFLILLVALLSLIACGSVQEPDTSQAPDRVSVNGNCTTYYWGKYSKFYCE